MRHHITAWFHNHDLLAYYAIQINCIFYINLISQYYREVMVFNATFNNISLSYIVTVNYSGDMH